MESIFNNIKKVPKFISIPIIITIILDLIIVISSNGIDKISFAQNIIIVIIAFIFIFIPIFILSYILHLLIKFINRNKNVSDENTVTDVINNNQNTYSDLNLSIQTEQQINNNTLNYNNISNTQNAIVKRNNKTISSIKEYLNPRFPMRFIWIPFILAFVLGLVSFLLVGDYTFDGFMPCFIIAIVLFVIFLIISMIIYLFIGKSVGYKEFINPYVDTNQFDKGDSFPSINYNNIFLTGEEKLIYAVPAAVFTDKEKVVGYTGNSGGVSVRVAKGIYLRTGSNRSQAIRKNIRNFAYGDYILTTKRLIFVPSDSSNSAFEFKVDKITAIKPITKDTMVVVCGSKQKNLVIPDSQIKYALGLLYWTTGKNNI